MHKIYHIPGVKIGCSTEPNKRVRVQGFSNYEIIEEHDDIYIASDREQELQKEYGYRVDECPYWKSYQASVRRQTKEGRIKGGKSAGRMMVESGKLDLARLKSNEARRGTKHSDETKMKIRLARLGKPSPKKGKTYK
jgi:hypothetical protein